MIIHLTENDAQVLTQLLDIATKAGCLNVAEAAISFAKRIAEAAQAEQQPMPEAPE